MNPHERGGYCASAGADIPSPAPPTTAPVVVVVVATVAVCWLLGMLHLQDLFNHTILLSSMRKA